MGQLQQSNDPFLVNRKTNFQDGSAWKRQQIKTSCCDSYTVIFEWQAIGQMHPRKHFIRMEMDRWRNIVRIIQKGGVEMHLRWESI